MSSAGDFGNPLRKFKLVFLGEQSGKSDADVKSVWLNMDHAMEDIYLTN